MQISCFFSSCFVLFVCVFVFVCVHFSRVYLASPPLVVVHIFGHQEMGTLILLRFFLFCFPHSHNSPASWGLLNCCRGHPIPAACVGRPGEPRRGRGAGRQVQRPCRAATWDPGHPAHHRKVRADIPKTLWVVGGGVF